MANYSVTRAALYKNPFIGLYLRASETAAFIAQNASDKLKTQVSETLGVPVHPLLLCNSNLIGLFVALNATGAVVSASAEKTEIHALKKHGLNVAVLPDTFGAVSNNILTNDTAALVNPSMDKRYASKIADALGVEVFSQPVAGLKTVGAGNVVTNTGLLAFNDITDVELKLLAKLFKVDSYSRGTSNLGSPFNSLGVVANTKGALVGELTTGFELERIYAALASNTTD